MTLLFLLYIAGFYKKKYYVFLKENNYLLRSRRGKKSKVQRLGIWAYLEIFHARDFLTKSSVKQPITFVSKKMSQLRQSKYTAGVRVTWKLLFLPLSKGAQYPHHYCLGQAGCSLSQQTVNFLEKVEFHKLHPSFPCVTKNTADS